MKRRFLVTAGAAASAAIAISLFCACTTKTVKDPSAPRELVFPLGTYQHEVDVSLAGLPGASGPGDHPKEFHFRGMVSVSGDAIKVVGLSAMNTTIFRITEDRKSGKVNTEVYVDALKKVQNRFVDYYTIVRSVLTAPFRSGKESDTVTTETPAGATSIVFKDYDAQKIPGTVDVDNPKFKLHIKVTGYEI